MNWRIGSATQAPAYIFLLLLLLALLAQAVGVYILTQQPWTGIRTVLVPDKPMLLQVLSVAEGSPAAGTRLDPGGDGVSGPVWLRAVEYRGRTIALDHRVRTEPLAVPTYAAFAEYLALQGSLYEALSSGDQLIFELQSGEGIAVTPLPTTPISQIPGVFWSLFFINILGLIIGGLVWVFKTRQLESTALLLAGISYFCFETIFSVLISREFCLNPVLMQMLTSLEAAFLNLFVWALFVIIAYYPNRLLPTRAMYVISGLAVFLSLNYHFQWVQLPFHIFVFQFLPIYLIGVWLIYRQWRSSAQRPLDRTAALVLQLSAAIPCGIIMLFYSLPVIVGQPPILGIISTRLLLVTIFIGWAVGILRYRLFEVEYWWFKSLLWLVGGCLVFVVDMLLAGVLHASEHLSGSSILGLSVIIAGFIYFPVRQWLIRKMMPDESRSLQDFLPDFSVGLSGAITQEGFEQRWQAALQNSFHPLNLQPVSDPVAETALLDNGLNLLVPALDDQQPGYCLSGKQMAARLFNLRDTRHIESLLTIARMASQASTARHTAIMEERQRIMHDLHDTVGARLMTLTHTLREPDSKAAARDALATLRDTIRLSLKEPPLYLEEHLADWRAEVDARTEAAGVELVWQQQGIDDRQLSPKQVFELTQILRELVTNALKHAFPSRLEVRVELKEKVLRITVINDGAVSLPENWRAGTGMASLKKRVAGLGGQLLISKQQTGNCPELWVEVDLVL